MNSTPTKVAAVAVGLLSTWATAHADDFVVSVTPDAGQSIDNVELFSALTTTSTGTNPGTTTQTNEALTPNLGSASGGNAFSTTVSTSYGTSTTEGGVAVGADATFGLLATSNGLVVLGGSASTTGTTYNAQYGPTGMSQAQALTGIQSDSLSLASALFPDMSVNALYSASDLTSPVSGSLYAFGANGTATAIGTWSVTPQATPEPATLAALGMGALGLMRRRRKP